MTMGFLRRAGPWILGALVVLPLAVGYRFSVAASEKGFRRRCMDCDGTGKVTSSLWATCAENGFLGNFTVPCEACAGTGCFWVLEGWISAVLWDFFGDVMFLAILPILGTVVYAFKVVNCRRCGGVGCDACEGRGWRTTADCWAA
jgi:hypothetical protein